MCVCVDCFFDNTQFEKTSPSNRETADVDLYKQLFRFLVNDLMGLTPRRGISCGPCGRKSIPSRKALVLLQQV